MKRNFSWAFSLLLWLALAAGQYRAPAQEGWVAVGPANITNFNFQTVGGITYFTSTSWLNVDWCERVVCGPVAISSTNLSQVINEESWTGPCACDPGLCRHAETHVSVLGGLPSGNYRLQISTTATLPPHMYHSILFTVPVSDPATIHASTQTNRFILDVLGVSNVTYTVQASTDLVQWTTLASQPAAPFTWSEALSPDTASRFYRVQIVGR